MAAYEPASYTAIAAQTDFIIPWDYLRDSHVSCTVNAVAETDYTLVNNGTILRLDVALAGGETVVITRTTPIDSRLVDFVDGGGLSEDELNEAFNQLFFALEEYNYITGVADLTAYVTTAQTAAAAAQTAETNPETAETNAETAVTNAELAETNAEAAAASVAAFQNYLSGLGLSRSSATVVAVAAGVAQNTDNTQVMTLAAPANIDITTGSAASPAANGLSSNRAVSTWYHVYLIHRASDNNISVTASTSASSPTLPTGYSKHRRIGAFKLNATGSGEVIPFVQHGDDFVWTDPANLVLDHNQTATDFTAGVSISLANAVPGVRTRVRFEYFFDAHLASAAGIFFDGDATSAAPSETASPLVSFSISASADAGGELERLTDGASPAAIKYRTEGDNSTTHRVLVRG